MSQKSKRAVACHVDDGLQKKTRLADTGVLLVSPFLASVSPPLGARKRGAVPRRRERRGAAFLLSRPYYAAFVFVVF